MNGGEWEGNEVVNECVEQLLQNGLLFYRMRKQKNKNAALDVWLRLFQVRLVDWICGCAIFKSVWLVGRMMSNVQIVQDGLIARTKERLKLKLKSFFWGTLFSLIH